MGGLVHEMMFPSCLSNEHCRKGSFCNLHQKRCYTCGGSNGFIKSASFRDEANSTAFCLADKSHTACLQYGCRIGDAWDNTSVISYREDIVRKMSLPDYFAYVLISFIMSLEISSEVWDIRVCSVIAPPCGFTFGEITLACV